MMIFVSEHLLYYSTILFPFSICRLYCWWDLKWMRQHRCNFIVKMKLYIYIYSTKTFDVASCMVTEIIAMAMFFLDGFILKHKEFLNVYIYIYVYNLERPPESVVKEFLNCLCILQIQQLLEELDGEFMQVTPNLSTVA